MRAVFFLGLVAGLAAVLGAAHYYPWVRHPRVPAHTEVITNGGRAEAFVIRLPADRLTAAGAHEAGLRGEPWPAATFAMAATAPWLSEQFKVRDVDGQVIGVAARHWTVTAEGPAAAWCIVIPGRGTLLLAGPGESAGAVDAALRRAGYAAGAAWNGTLEVAVARGDAGEIVGGSAEFADLTGAYTETWSLTGVSAEGALRGTIELGTRTYTGL